MNAVPPDEAIARHAEMILDGNRFLADRPELILRDDEYVLEPDSADYRLPTLLLKTAPDLALCFQELLDALLHLNREHVDERVVDVQAYFSLTGEHEELEHAFYQWTMNYLSRRADLDRLNHRNAYDPSRLWVDTAKEIDELIERRIGMVNTINSSALNLAQAAYLHHPYAMVVADHKRRGGDGHVFEPNRYSIPDFNNSVFYALQTKQRFETFLKQVASRLPVEDQTPRHDRHSDDVVMRNQQFAEDLNLIRLISTNTQQFDVPLPTNCGYMLQAVWAISCGRSILTLLVFDEP